MSGTYTITSLTDTIDQASNKYDTIDFGSYRFQDFTFSFNAGNLYLTRGSNVITIKGWDLVPATTMIFNRVNKSWIDIDEELGYYGINCTSSTNTTQAIDCATQIYNTSYTGVIIHGMQDNHMSYSAGTATVTDGTYTVVLQNANQTTGMKAYINGQEYACRGTSERFMVGSGVEGVLGTTGADNFVYVNPHGVNDVTSAVVYADAGNDCVNLVGSASVGVNGGDGDDVVRVFSGSNNTLKGNDGNDVLVLYGTGTQKKLKGGTGNDTYKIMSSLAQGEVITIDQSDVDSSDKDTLILAKVSKSNISYARDNNALVLTDTSGGKVYIDEWSNGTMKKIVFKDGVVKADAINAKYFPTVVNITSSMTYDSTDEADEFVFDRSSNTYIEATLIGADSNDSITWGNLGLSEDQSFVLHFSEKNTYDLRLKMEYLDPQYNDTIEFSRIVLKDYLKNNDSLKIDGTTYNFITDATKSFTVTSESNHLVIFGDDNFDATISGADSNTILYHLNIEEDDLDNDFVFSKNGTDLILTGGDEHTAKATFKNFYASQPGIHLVMEDYLDVVLKSGTTGNDTVSLNSYLNASQAEGILYIGLTGSDNITATTGYNYIYGGEGVDTITVDYSNGGGGYINGGEGNDIITVNGTAKPIYVVGGAGDDKITFKATSTNQHSYIYSGAGIDTIDIQDNGQYGSLSVYGGADDDIITFASQAETKIYGGDGDDQIKVAWAKLKNLTICNSFDDNKDKYDDEENDYHKPTAGDKDTLIIEGAALADVQFAYDNVAGTLYIYDAVATKTSTNTASGWDYSKQISITGWKDVPLTSIAFVKNGSTTTYTTAQITQLYSGTTYGISKNNPSASSTEKIDTYQFIGSGWDATIDGFGYGDILDFSNYNSGQYYLQYSYDSTNSNYTLKLLKGGTSSEESYKDIGTVTLTNVSGEATSLSAVVKSADEEQAVPLYYSNYRGTTLQVLSAGTTLYADDNNIQYIITGDGDDTVYLTAGGQGLSTNAGNDKVYIYSANNTNYSGITTGAGDDIIYINGKNNNVGGEAGSDQYFVEWSLASGSYIYDYASDNSDTNSLRIYNAKASNLIFKTSSYSDYILILADANGNTLEISNWQAGFTNGITFDDGTLSVKEIAAKIAAHECSYAIDATTPTNSVFTASDEKQDTFVFSGSGWQAVVNNLDSSEDILDFSAYNNDNYFLKYSSDTKYENNSTTYGKNLYLEVVQATNSGFTTVGKVTLNDFFSGTSGESKSLNLRYYQYGYLQYTNEWTSNYASSENTYYSLGNFNLDNLPISDDNARLELNTLNSDLHVVLNGDADYVNTSSGDDVIHANGYDNDVYTNYGNDEIYVNASSCYVNAGSGDDVIYINERNCDEIACFSADAYGDAGNDKYVVGLNSSEDSFNINIDNYDYSSSSDAYEDSLIIVDEDYKSFKLSNSSNSSCLQLTKELSQDGYISTSILAISGWTNDNLKTIKVLDTSCNKSYTYTSSAINSALSAAGTASVSFADISYTAAAFTAEDTQDVAKLQITGNV